MDVRGTEDQARKPRGRHTRWVKRRVDDHAGPASDPSWICPQPLKPDRLEKDRQGFATIQSVLSPSPIAVRMAMPGQQRGTLHTHGYPNVPLATADDDMPPLLAYGDQYILRADNCARQTTLRTMDGDEVEETLAPSPKRQRRGENTPYDSPRRSSLVPHFHPALCFALGCVLSVVVFTLCRPDLVDGCVQCNYRPPHPLSPSLVLWSGRMNRRKGARLALKQALLQPPWLIPTWLLGATTFALGLTSNARHRLAAFRLYLAPTTAIPPGAPSMRDT